MAIKSRRGLMDNQLPAGIVLLLNLRLEPFVTALICLVTIFPLFFSGASWWNPRLTTIPIIERETIKIGYLNRYERNMSATY